jgi:hypothetical protein
MQPFAETLMAVLGAMILLCIAFGFLGSLFLLGSFALVVFEYLIWIGKRVYRQGHAFILQLRG